MSYSGKTTSYLQDVAAGLPVVLQETVGSQAPSSFMYPLGSTSPMYQSDPDNAGMWYHADGLGSVRVLTDGSTGAIISSNSYSAFGLNVGATGKAANSHGFAGEQLDPTGLYFNRARYYSPSLGRFIGRDSYAGNTNNALSQNRYAYGWNNPVLQTDPGGNEPPCTINPLIGAIGNCFGSGINNGNGGQVGPGLGWVDSPGGVKGPSTTKKSNKDKWVKHVVNGLCLAYMGILLWDTLSGGGSGSGDLGGGGYPFLPPSDYPDGTNAPSPIGVPISTPSPWGGSGGIQPGNPPVSQPSNVPQPNPPVAPGDGGNWNASIRPDH